MPKFEFAQSQNTVKVTPTFYNVSPGRGAEAAVAELQKAASSFGALKSRIDQDNYEAALLDQKTKASQFGLLFDEANYEQRKELMKGFEDEFINKYDTKDSYGKKLASNGVSLFNQFQSTLVKQGIKEEYLNNQTDMRRSFLDYQSEWAGMDIQQKGDALLEMKNNLVAPYANFDDEYSRALYNEALEKVGDFEKSLNKDKVKFADSRILSDSLAAISAGTQINSVPTQEQYNQYIDHLRGVSDFEQNETKYRNEVDKAIMYSLIGQIRNPDFERTYENINALKDKILAFGELSSSARQSDTYNKTLTSLNTAISSINKEDRTDLLAMIQDDTTSSKEVTDRAKLLKDRKVISDEEESYYNFSKSQNMIQRNTKPQVSAAYAADDTDRLIEFTNSGQGAVVKKIVTDNLNTELGALLEQGAPPEAFKTILGRVAEYKKKGIPVGGLQIIDDILKKPKNGGLQTEQDVDAFLITAKAAIDNNYQSTEVSKNIGDYFVLRTFKAMGVEDIAGKYRAYKSSVTTVSNKDVNETLEDIFDENYIPDRDLNERNRVQLRDALGPAVKAMLKAGIPKEELADNWEDIIYSKFIEADSPGWFNGRILMPKAGRIDSDDAYETIANYFGKNAYVSPKDILNPTGMWMVLSDDGEPQEFPFEYMEAIAETGLPPKE